MDQTLDKKIFYIKGMTCPSCERKIEKALKKIEGIQEVKASFSKSSLDIIYDGEKVALDKIVKVIEKLGYQVLKNRDKGQTKEGEDKDTILGSILIIIALYVLVKHTIGFNFLPKVDESMGYGLLFIVGLLTSIHCIAMCGGINLSQCIAYKNDDKNSRFNKLKPSLLYNLGRVLSYTILGGVVGSLGSIVSFSGGAKGMVAIIAGVLMMIMGLNMIDLFPFLRRFTPRMPRFFGNIINNSNRKSPFYIGLLNGFMPCGPLQTMQLYALGTGSFIKGAASMFIFAIGTVPLMFGFGAMGSFLKDKFTSRMLKMSAVLVIVLGFIMMQRGLSLSGVQPSLQEFNPLNQITLNGGENINEVSGKTANMNGEIQEVAIDLSPYGYEPIIVQKGIPVKFIIHAEESSINGCNRAIIIPDYGIEKELNPGENIIEFTPKEEGNIPYSCWMGMIRSNIQVVSDLSNFEK